MHCTKINSLLRSQSEKFYVWFIRSNIVSSHFSNKANPNVYTMFSLNFNLWLFLTQLLPYPHYASLAFKRLLYLSISFNSLLFLLITTLSVFLFWCDVINYLLSFRVSERSLNYLLFLDLSLFGGVITNIVLIF